MLLVQLGFLIPGRHMACALTDVLNERFAEAGVGSGQQERADRLSERRTTYNKIVNGSLSLTMDRARKWAASLYPSDVERQGECAAQLVEAAHLSSRIQTMDAFCESLSAEGGAVAGERVKDLLEALGREKEPLVCGEYRDVPRAGRSGRYEGIGPLVGEAVAGGLTFAMFQPFGNRPPLPPKNRASEAAGPTQSFAAASYMSLVREKCRSAYQAFLHYAEQAHDELKERADNGDEEASQILHRDLRPIGSRIRLYERASGLPYLGSGIQSNLFYMQWISQKHGIDVRDQRIFQWVSTPARDLLIYRGRGLVDPDAVRDTFFPVPHYFDFYSDHSLPVPTAKLCDQLEKDLPEKMELPFKYHVWEAWKG